MKGARAQWGPNAKTTESGDGGGSLQRREGVVVVRDGDDDVLTSRGYCEDVVGAEGRQRGGGRWEE